MRTEYDSASKAARTAGVGVEGGGEFGRHVDGALGGIHADHGIDLLADLESEVGAHGLAEADHVLAAHPGHTKTRRASADRHGDRERLAGAERRDLLIAEQDRRSRATAGEDGVQAQFAHSRKRTPGALELGGQDRVALQDQPTHVRAQEHRVDQAAERAQRRMESHGVVHQRAGRMLLEAVVVQEVAEQAGGLAV